MLVHRVRLLSLVVLVLLAASAQTGPIKVVVPNALAEVEGPNNNAFPFGDVSRPTQRYQQIYAADQFAALGGPGLITHLSFRKDGIFGSTFSSTVNPNTQINFSTTSLAADGLSTTFAANVGPNDTVVYSGPLPLTSSATGPVGGPMPFDVTIPLQTPFLYDPRAGNLLLDVRRFAFNDPFFPNFTADAVRVTGDPVSRVFTNVNFPEGVNSPVGVAESLGLVTQFTITPIPEPGTLGALGLALAVSAVMRRNSRPRGGRAASHAHAP